MLKIIDSPLKEVGHVLSHVGGIRELIVHYAVPDLIIQLISQAIVHRNGLLNLTNFLEESFSELALLLGLLHEDAVGFEVEYSFVALLDVFHVDHTSCTEILQLHVGLTELI